MFLTLLAGSLRSFQISQERGSEEADLSRKIEGDSVRRVCVSLLTVQCVVVS